MFYASSSGVANVSLIDKSTASFCLSNLKCFHIRFVLSVYFGLSLQAAVPKTKLLSSQLGSDLHPLSSF